MSEVAGQLTIGPLATARRQTLAACSVERDEPQPPRTRGLAASEAIVYAVAAVLVALMIAAVGQAMPRTSAEALIGNPDEVIVISPDDKEPFVVCPVRAGSCKNLDLNPAQP